jgi:leader peptidase (prepilin peptidase) / N-methyltransferase
LELVTAHSGFLIYISAFIFGSVVGSFLNVCIYRLPREESIVFPPSHCASCGTQIKFYNNIPIVSYLFLLGKCKTCGKRISPTYPIVEILSGIISAFLVWRFGFTLQTIFYIIFLSALLVVTFIDIKHQIIPNVITLPGIIVGLIYGAIRTDWGSAQQTLNYLHPDLWSILRILNELPIVDSLSGMILGGGMLFLVGFLYEIIRKREGMGLGDVKLLAMIGAFLGWKSVLFVALVSSFIGTIVGISIILYKRGDLKYAIPFGPFLSLAAALYCFTGGFSFRF